MSFKAAFARIFGAGKPATEKSAPLGSARRKGGSAMEQGFLVFEQTGDVISAERLLRKEGFAVEVKAPPAASLDYVPVSDPLLGPVSLFQVTDFGKWFMVRAANMKVTVEKESGRIVNVSGGGCPDVPYLAGLLLGKSLDEADEPRLYGKTLCSYALQRAFEEAKRVWRG